MKMALDRATREETESFKPLNGLDLLSALVHELSQPLTVLMGEFELAASCPPNLEEYRDLVERALIEINRATACMILFRDLAPVPDSAQALPASLNDLLKRLCDLLTPAAESQGCRIEFSSSMPLSVQAQGCRLQIIFSRLMQKLLAVGGPGCILRVGLQAHEDMASVVFSASLQSDRQGEVPSAVLPVTTKEIPVINPKDPDWVLGRWVAESSGGSFDVAISEPAAWQVTMTFPINQAGQEPATLS